MGEKVEYAHFDNVTPLRGQSVVQRSAAHLARILAQSSMSSGGTRDAGRLVRGEPDPTLETREKSQGRLASTTCQIGMC